MKTLPRLLFVVTLLGLCISPWFSWAHDHDRPDLDKWYAALKVPNEGLPLAKGASCCHRKDCKQRPVIIMGPGRYQTMADDGTWEQFTPLAEITEPWVLVNNPSFSWTVCIHGGKVVCYVRGRAGF